MTILNSVDFAATLNASVLGLFHGLCGDAFGQELGYFHFVDVYQFEGDADVSQAWRAWGGATPIITSRDSLCGRYSLFVRLLSVIKCWSVNFYLYFRFQMGVVWHRIPQQKIGLLKLTIAGVFKLAFLKQSQKYVCMYVRMYVHVLA